MQPVYVLLLSVLPLLQSCQQQPAPASKTPTLLAGTPAKSILNIRSILQDKKGVYWFGSDGDGLYRYEGRSLTLFTEKDGLPNNQVRDIQEDASGNIWLNTGKGIASFDGKAFRSFKDYPATEGMGYSESLWLKAPSDLWFAGGGGAYRYTGDSFAHYTFPEYDPASKPSSVPYNEYDVYCTFQDRDGNLWFGTQSKGVCRFDGKTFTWWREKGLAGAAVRVIYQDKSGNLWFGNNGYGLFRYDGKTLHNFTEEKGLGNPDFVKNLQGKEGTLARIWSIAEDAGGDLWIGTIDAGAWRYDGKKLSNYSKKEGLTDLSVTAIYRDAKGELWFGTTSNLFTFKDKSFVKFEVR